MWLYFRFSSERAKLNCVTHSVKFEYWYLKKLSMIRNKVVWDNHYNSNRLTVRNIFLFCYSRFRLMCIFKVGLRCSLILLWHRKCHCKVWKMYWSMPFYKFGCSYVMLYNFQNAWCSFCLFCDYWFEIINYNMLYIHVLQMYCMWIKDGVHFKFNSGPISGLPTELPTISILESSGLPTELRLSCPLYP